jgi:uncharacterized coiled-coil protein SlyX
MLVALGFLAACLLALMIAPAFYSRAVRLTTRRLKESMPLSEVEIRADKDRIRAEHAIKVHRLENDMEQVRLAAARQQIEINRRDARINDLEAQYERLKAGHEETQNARRVLEQTVADRLPRVEQRLHEAKRLLFARDREIADLSQTTTKQAKAIGEASAINAQSRAEIDRLTAALASRPTSAEAHAQRSDAEVALRTELEGLRAKTREQAQLLARLQSMSGRMEPAAAALAGAGQDGSKDADRPILGDASSGDRAAMLARVQAELEKQVRTLKARNDDQSAEIARLKASLKVLEDDIEGESKLSLRETRIGMKARVQSLEAETQQQHDTIQKLRSELAASNERIARQANHFTNELRRLGTGPGQAAAGRRASEEAVRLSLTQRVSQARSPASKPGEQAAVQGAPAAQDAAEPAETTKAPVLAAVTAANAATGPSDGPPAATAAPAQPEAADTSKDQRDVERRPRLLERISSLSRSS